MLWKTFEKLSVMENNWIVREMLLANGFILFIMKMKKVNHLNILI
jgi:hypothetical protein